MLITCWLSALRQVIGDNSIYSLFFSSQHKNVTRYLLLHTDKNEQNGNKAYIYISC